MKTYTFKSVLIMFKEYIIMMFAMFLYAFGWIACVLPAHCTSGGAGGFALVATEAMKYIGVDIQMGTMVFVINGILMIIGGLIVGWNFGPKTIFCVAMIGLGMNFWQWLLFDSGYVHDFHIFAPETPDGIFPDGRLLPMVLGGIFAGTGIALCFSQGGTTGGTDIVALIVQKFKNVNYGKVLISTDAIIIGSAYFVGFDIPALIYGLIMTVVVGYTADAWMSGNKQSRQIMIITPDYEKMADAITKTMHRGVTVIDSQGWYTKKKGKIVVVVCRKFEAPIILRFVKTVDSKAFITVSSVMGAYGEGFDALNKV